MGLEAWDDIMWLKEFFLVFPVRAACYWTKYSWSSFILGLLKVPFIFLKYLFYTLILIFNRKNTQQRGEEGKIVDVHGGQNVGTL